MHYQDKFGMILVTRLLSFMTVQDFVLPAVQKLVQLPEVLSADHEPLSAGRGRAPGEDVVGRQADGRRVVGHLSPHLVAVVVDGEDCWL